jgi:predicted nuclease of predicted toxin-antitoxin system
MIFVRSANMLPGWVALFDENLSRRLVVPLAELYPESAHVVEFELLNSSDREIWEFATTLRLL